MFARATIATLAGPRGISAICVARCAPDLLLAANLLMFCAKLDQGVLASTPSLTDPIPTDILLAVAVREHVFANSWGCVMYLYSKKLLGRENLYWFVLGVAILIPLVMVCTILCLLDIPHWPMWR